MEQSKMGNHGGLLVGSPAWFTTHCAINKDQPNRKANAIYSDLQTARESDTITCVLTENQRQRVGKDYGGKKEGPQVCLGLRPSA